MKLDQIEAIEAIVYKRCLSIDAVATMDVEAVIDEIMALPSMSRYPRETLRSLVASVAAGSGLPRLIEAFPWCTNMG